MKKTALIAFAGAMMISGAAFANAESVKENYVSGAFSDADEDWLRITANRIPDCGTYGSNDRRRVDLLVATYNALGDALESGDEAEIETAAANFNKVVGANSRFESCWDSISSKKGVSGKFKREVAKM
ncbi:MAG: hypothetical protein KAH44_25740 [Oricola sp.]|jgi:hypothetical protein|nr:hypothetical protein [Oricola sp.]